MHGLTEKERKRKRAGRNGEDPAAAAAGGLENEGEGEGDTALEFGRHPYGIQPLGNMFGAEVVLSRADGLGALAVLPDEIILQILGTLSAQDLSRACQASRSMYVFCHFDELWRDLVIAHYANVGFAFVSSWRDTMVRELLVRRNSGDDCDQVRAFEPHQPLAIRGFFSDTLFQPWYCASMSLNPAWISGESIPREANLSLEDFARKYSRPNMPVIITDVVRNWPAFTKWSREYLTQTCDNKLFEAGPMFIRIQDYFAYAEKTHDDRPYFIFDKHFFDKAPSLLDDYTNPEYFQEDLFSVLGDQRPNFRWFITGPARSGSSWHVDPNATSAWNGVIRGHKRWIMCPPSAVPPGVRPSADGAEVTTPMSLTEWYEHFYAKLVSSGLPFYAGTCAAGEMIFVPTGWWHMVLNLDETLAVTQNFACSDNLHSVLAFLKDKRDQVSGCDHCEDCGSMLYERFTEALERDHPEVIRAATQRMNRPKSLWERAKAAVPACSAPAAPTHLSASTIPASVPATSSFSFFSTTTPATGTSDSISTFKFGFQ